MYSDREKYTIIVYTRPIYDNSLETNDNQEPDLKFFLSDRINYLDIGLPT